HALSPTTPLLPYTMLFRSRTRRLDHHVHALAEHVELGVGHQDGDLHQRVGHRIESGHLTIDPHEVLCCCCHGPTVAPRPVVVCRSEEHTSELQSRENLVCR